MKKLLFPVLLVAMFFASCGDDNGPTVQITSPQDGATYSPGDIVNLSISASDDVAVTSMDATFLAPGLPAQTLPFDLSIVSDPSSFIYNADLPLDSLAPIGEYEFSLLASDADGNTDEDKIKFNIQ